ncbi:MAG TPA: SgcJ/EcaC family oxidoreductase [Longimicrobium sp.]|jgi:uncharacterized protein (TIGR02246 family)|nr:SgcJ/EcaC family oxidoreductase [Longimicrobium sp.]
MTETAAASGEAGLRALIEDRARAIRAKDVAAVLSVYAPDVVSFDLVDPLRHVGRESIRTRLEAWLSQFREGPIGYELRDLQLTVGDDVAFCHSLSHVDATTTDGRRIEMWWRATSCFRRIGGRWRVTHEHSSVPFDMESLKASLDLEP